MAFLLIGFSKLKVVVVLIRKLVIPQGPNLSVQGFGPCCAYHAVALILFFGLLGLLLVRL